MKSFLSTLLVIISLNGIGQSLTEQIDSFLKANVKDGLVNYKAVKENPAALNAILNQLNRAQLFKGDAEKAFLLNAYNVFVIKGIVDYYPVEGPLKIDGFFDTKTFKLRGQAVTLNGVEKKMLYPQFPDARLHFALVCAAIDCPKLASYAYVADSLDAQLEKQTRSVINDPTFIRLDGPHAKVSQIFDWYADDFGGKENVIPFTQKYLLKKVKLNPTYSFYEYDWSLNELK